MDLSSIAAAAGVSSESMSMFMLTAYKTNNRCKKPNISILNTIVESYLVSADPEGGQLLPRPDAPDRLPWADQGVEEPGPDPVQHRHGLGLGRPRCRADGLQPGGRGGLDLGVGEAGDPKVLGRQLELQRQVAVPVGRKTLKVLR